MILLKKSFAPSALAYIVKITLGILARDFGDIDFSYALI